MSENAGPASGDTAAVETTHPEGRFFLISGPGSDAVATALTARLPRAASVDGQVVDAMFVADDVPQLERLFLRWTAGIALADSFRYAGFDAVVSESVPEQHIEDFLDFAAPATVHLVRLDDAGDAQGRWGLCLPAGPAEEVVDAILARLDDARIETDDVDPEGEGR